MTTARLIRVHRGVYAVGHRALSDRARMIAGLLARPVRGPLLGLVERAAAPGGAEPTRSELERKLLRSRARPSCRRSGYRVLRFTWRQVMGETLLVTVRIAQLLAAPPTTRRTPPRLGGR